VSPLTITVQRFDSSNTDFYNLQLFLVASCNYSKVYLFNTINDRFNVYMPSGYINDVSDYHGYIVFETAIEQYHLGMVMSLL
jgi:hypothetical protein